MTRRSVSFVAAFAVAMMLASPPPIARADPDDTSQREMIAGGAWTPGPNVPCAAGRVTDIGPRLEEPPGTPALERFGSGVSVELAIPTAPRWFNGRAFPRARVVHYQDELGNATMSAERVGDRVQVCFVGFPTPRHDPATDRTECDPNADPRGFSFRVYDYRLKKAYAGPDSQHDCGGA